MSATLVQSSSEEYWALHTSLIMRASRTQIRGELRCLKLISGISWSGLRYQKGQAFSIANPPRLVLLVGLSATCGSEHVQGCRRKGVP